MTRYYFDLENGDGFTKDTLGRNLPNVASVHREVATIMLDVAGDELNGAAPFAAKVTVRDEVDAVVLQGLLEFRIFQ